MLNYLKARNNIPYIIGVLILMAGLFAYPYYYGIDVSEHIEKNTPLMTLGVVLMLVPLFINATTATLKSDLLDDEMLGSISEKFRDFENYKHEPLVIAISRLYIEGADQKSYSLKNLALGFGLTIVSLILAVNLVFVSRGLDHQNFEVHKYLLTYLYPRVGAIAFIQIIAAFFFGWYAKNVRKIGEISDKILIIEMKIAALLESGEYSSRSDVLNWLSNVNFSDIHKHSRKIRNAQGLLEKALERSKITISNK